jgi:hypothetical protein
LSGPRKPGTESPREKFWGHTGSPPARGNYAHFPVAVWLPGDREEGQSKKYFLRPRRWASCRAQRKRVIRPEGQLVLNLLRVTPRANRSSPGNACACPFNQLIIKKKREGFYYSVSDDTNMHERQSTIFSHARTRRLAKRGVVKESTL